VKEALQKSVKWHTETEHILADGAKASLVDMVEPMGERL